LTVTSPNGGEVWGEGKIKNITWFDASTTAGIYDIMIIDSIGENGGVIGAAVTGNSFTWAVGSLTGGSALPPGSYKIRVVRKYPSGAIAYEDQSNIPFQITENASAPTVRLTSPDGGNLLQLATSHLVQWVDTAIGATSYDLYLVSTAPGEPLQRYIGRSNFGATSFRWTVGLSHTPVELLAVTKNLAAYRLKVCRVGESPCDQSDTLFSFSEAPANTISVAYPNGGDALARGASHLIRWTDQHTGNSQHALYLVKNKFDSSLGHIVTTQDYIGLSDYGRMEYAWTPSPTLEAGTYYRVKVCPAGVARCDQSDSEFSLN
jgi:hypothetical protein